MGGEDGGGRGGEGAIWAEVAAAVILISVDQSSEI